MKYVLAKEILIALVLLSVIVGNGWDAEAAQRITKQGRHIDHHAHGDAKVREKRFSLNPFASIISIWGALTHMYQLYTEQKNETKSAFEQSHDIIADGFNDTYLATKRPTTTTTAAPGSEPVSSTEHYRITRKELGYILGRNYRGLKKLFNIEWNDAINQSKYNIQEYKVEKAWSLYPYTIKKPIPPPKGATVIEVP